MNFGLNLVQEQKLIMTQEMQMSVKLLQMSAQELGQYVNKEMQENPVLEEKDLQNSKSNDYDVNDYKEIIKYLDKDGYKVKNHATRNDGDEVSPFYYIAEEKSLKDYIKQQIGELTHKSDILSICKYMAENLDDKGYLSASLPDICKELGISNKKAEVALSIFQSLDPEGIGARNLRECLTIQLYNLGMDDENICKIINDYLELLAENKYSEIAKKLKINISDVQKYGDIIKNLEPKPSRGFYTGETVKYVVPDAYINKIDDQYVISMNEDVLPKLNINNLYKEIIKDEKDTEAVEYVKDKLNSAMFLIKSIEQRKNTVYRVLEEILEVQREYFDRGVEYLKPMTLKIIANNLEMHESTISRAIREKYVSINDGKVVKIKDFFTNGITSGIGGEDISTINIKKNIKELVESEDTKKPMSDQIICNRLNDEGVNISRRTVAKYREELEIKSSSKRKRF
ncbi:RNA polymerase factor sigma-54 [Clostridium estertheticum]|uniref:RNA polymerase factor sigma-54 n=1 Tax=Clostridium estertheticum TaxID=238834 RepID=UPI00148E6A28|nr:RNA polymerase factor sigma-54 [Clostridium estertheticum]MBW9170284.1 RNA polymerase factor sigma-54 [Clostridium estertheticum]MBX4263510.1 RNA polymerase factor sigma-54 [Clostridium estertheticum]MBX4270023.1 RNA polymerase factor sigma-54 [Clostridium estertheticum]WBL49146.1 RNA polymerase factor sigma-54 [Clostridium estertheticum]WLC77285.1 RNA polymerase factor sigma-54 [Clostridium estertheticum]